MTHNNIIHPWRLTSSENGFANRWRALAKGHEVMNFAMWLYCDDTSGNVSKKWNKHNSFLFTAAGLPQKYGHQESNVHFLCTSNLAPPLEMLDGITTQLECVSLSIFPIYYMVILCSIDKASLREYGCGIFCVRLWCWSSQLF